MSISQYYHNQTHPKLKQLAAICSARYDYFIVCDTDIPYDNTWDRSGEVNRKRMQRMTISYLEQHNIPYTVVSGDVQQRIQQVSKHIEDKI